MLVAHLWNTIWCQLRIIVKGPVGVALENWEEMLKSLQVLRDICAGHNMGYLVRTQPQCGTTTTQSARRCIEAIMKALLQASRLEWSWRGFEPLTKEQALEWMEPQGTCAGVETMEQGREKWDEKLLLFKTLSKLTLNTLSEPLECSKLWNRVSKSAHILFREPARKWMGRPASW